MVSAGGNDGVGVEGGCGCGWGRGVGGLEGGGG